jgi:hypothetical protein
MYTLVFTPIEFFFLVDCEMNDDSGILMALLGAGVVRWWGSSKAQPVIERR